MTTAIASNPTANGRVREPDALDKAGGGALSEIERAEIEGDDPREGRLAPQLDRLARLAGMGMELAEGLTRKAARIEAEAEGEEIAPGYEGVCLAFARIARAIRQINAQEQEILGLREQVRREARQARTEAEEAAAGERKESVRRQVVGAVRDLLDADDEIDIEARDDLLGDLGRDYDDYYDLCQGAFDEIVGRIRRDLGIAEPGPKPARSKSKPRPKRAKRAKESKPGAAGDSDDEAVRRTYAALARLNGHDPP